MPTFKLGTYDKLHASHKILTFSEEILFIPRQITTTLKLNFQL